MESKPEAAVAAEATPAAETPAPEAPVEKRADEQPAEGAEKKKLDRAQRNQLRKEQLKARRLAAKEAKAANKAKAGEGEVPTPEGAAPKITVAKIPESFTSADLKALFDPHGTVLRAEISRRKGRPTIGTLYFNSNGDVRRAVEALHGKHKCEGVEEPLSIQYSRDAKDWGEFIKKSVADVNESLQQNGYKPGVLRPKSAKDFLNRMLLARKKAPATDLLTAALLVFTGSATAEQLVQSKLINSASAVQQLLKDEKVTPHTAKLEAAARAKGPVKGKKEEPATAGKAAPKVDKTFDAVVPLLDKLEKDRWNRMAKANLKLNERHRFRFVDILATPSLELWRWMVEDCDMTPAEAGTCFAILQNYYGFTK